MNITASSGCQWTATSNNGFITISSGSIGTGNGTVGYSVAPNASASPLMGTMTIGGQTFIVNQAGAVVCAYTLSAANTNIAASTGSGIVGITAGNGCAWTAVANAVWLHTSSSGSSNGSVGYTFDANASASARSGSISVAGQTFTVNQAGAVVCTYTLSATSTNVAATAGSGSVGITAGNGCAWTAVANAAWLHTSSSGSGNGVVNYTFDANTSASARSGSITVAGQTFTVSQAGAVVCTYTLAAASTNVAATAGSGSVGITASAGCAWTAVANAAWLRTSSSGSGNGTVSYTFDANTNASARSGSLTVAGQTITANQAGTVASNLTNIFGNSATAGPDLVHRIDKTTGALIQNYNVSSGNGRGVVVVGNIIYSTQSGPAGNIFGGDNHIYMTDRSTGLPLGSITVAGLPAGVAMSTLAWDGSHFWTSEYLTGPHAYQIDLAGNITKTISLGTGVSKDGMEYFNGKLIANRGDGVGPYDVYDLDGNLLQPAFIDPSTVGVSFTTGIAFDGTDFYTSDLRIGRLEIWDGTTGAYRGSLVLTGGNFSIEDLSFDYSLRTDTGGLQLNPANATNTVGQTHTVTACVKSNGVELANVTIDIAVTGANVTNGTCTSGTDGCCDFSYVGINAGDDTITATAVVVAGLTNSATATKVWIGGTLCKDVSIAANFNGTAIAASNTIWFSSVLKPSGLGTNPVTICFSHQKILIGTSSVSVPNATVTFDPTATCATTIFTNDRWVTVAPASGLAGDTFLSGVEVASPGLPGGIKNVTWSGEFVTSRPGVSLNWQWAAAVYTCFKTDPNVLGVKAVDDNRRDCIYKSSDHAGTPENIEKCLTGGATGGGGANYTGGLSGTLSVTPCPGTCSQ